MTTSGHIAKMESNIVLIPALFVFINHVEKAFSINVMFLVWNVGFAISFKK